VKFTRVSSDSLPRVNPYEPENSDLTSFVVEKKRTGEFFAAKVVSTAFKFTSNFSNNLILSNIDTN